MKRLNLFYLPALCFFLCAFDAAEAQNSVGLISNDETKSSPGYNLFFPHNQSTVFLVDNCGRRVHEWTDDAEYRPGNAVYLLENGNLVKCKRLNNSINDPIWAGGGGATVEILSWDNRVFYSYTLNDSLFRLHHDVAPLPNGNILLLAWAKKSGEEAIEAGRDPALLPQGKLWSEAVMEWDPAAGEIVWEWHLWDHLVQDFDAAKDNFGVVGEHPELVDVNYDEVDGHPDWLHMNAIAYNPVLDQIMLSTPHFNEVWIIDHSTTTAEAATHEGGKSGRGGDLLYRWGNPAAYRQGTAEDQTLFFQHDAHWADPAAQPGEAAFGQIAVFNNRVGAELSTADMFLAPFDADDWSYTLEGPAYGPETFQETKTHPDGSIRGFSSGLSSVQILPNGNWLILSGRWGYAYELTPSDKIVWEYVVPLQGGAPVSQGVELGIVDNLTFRLTRYPPEFPGFSGKDLSPKGYIELNPNADFCGQTTAVAGVQAASGLRAFPNPTSGVLTVESASPAGRERQAQLLDAVGRPVRRFSLKGSRTELDLGDLPSGLYLLKTENQALRVLLQPLSRP